MEHLCLRHGAIVGARCRCGVCVDEQIARLEHERDEAREECDLLRGTLAKEMEKRAAAERTLEAVRTETIEEAARLCERTRCRDWSAAECGRQIRDQLLNW